MKTKKVRPVLVEIKFNSIEEMQGNIIRRNDKIYTCEQLNILQLHKKESNDKVFELILLSLEDEEIKIGEIGLDLRDNTLFEVKRILTNHYESGILSFQKSYCKKVIARQSQIPQEYISKFIEQYNNDCVEDLEIEMEDKIAIDGHTIIGIEPKITNGFVTIVEKKQIYFPIKVTKDTITLYGAGKFQEEKLILDKAKAFLLFIELWKFLEIRKEPISYTEEEVRKLISEALYHFCPMNNHREEDEIDWFENNKKK